jgi:hypothetical protein
MDSNIRDVLYAKMLFPGFLIFSVKHKSLSNIWQGKKNYSENLNSMNENAYFIAAIDKRNEKSLMNKVVKKDHLST